MRSEKMCVLRLVNSSGGRGPGKCKGNVYEAFAPSFAQSHQGKLSKVDVP